MFGLKKQYKKSSRTAVHLIRLVSAVPKMFSSSIFSLLALSAVAVFAYDPNCTDNLVVYWGQNSYGATHPDDPSHWQTTISDYCQDTVIDVIPIAFVDSFTGGVPDLSICDDNGVSGSCMSLAAGIAACQAAGKLVTLSLGGGGTSGAVFSSDSDATTFATTIWNNFLGGSSSHRPFGSAILDGVDLDIESGSSTGFAAFAAQIRWLSAGTGRHYYLTAAPQCPFPDAYVGSAINTDWNFGVWDNWAKTVSPNPHVKIFIGAPASITAANPGEYVDATTLGSIALATRAEYSSFGGVMLWDASQAVANGNYHQQIKNIIAADGCAAGSGGSGGGSSGGSGCTHTYTVVSGDTCSAIESITGLSDAQLHALNPAINNDCTNLEIGQILCLGGGCTQTYTVVSGDTCSAIESAKGVSDAQLHALNPSINSGCTNLEIGQILCLSGGCTQTYTVVSGDTCSAIESAEGVSDAQLHALNPAINSGCTNLEIGQILCV
ncbi:glycoside hydrolase superfamily [Mycena albidolilacea]|uniref:chitinase n=1 Tax=Mycena albidolilacea TaxID=1033008 RepID=A0AAD7A1Y0_9AGAR|nr:glycoside hydrolase superfamily [Mycena albidolilacea]